MCMNVCGCIYSSRLRYSIMINYYVCLSESMCVSGCVCHSVHIYISQSIRRLVSPLFDQCECVCVCVCVSLSVGVRAID